MREPAQTMPIKAARDLLLRGQGLLADPGRAASASAVLDEIRSLGFVQLDSICTVERFSPDFKAPLPLADLDYERQAHAVPNRDGSLVLFSSDWGDPGSNAIVHDYVVGVRVP